MHYILYRTTNLINGNTYVGVHKTNNLDDGYLGSGKLLRRAVAKYGKASFVRETLESFSCQEDMYSREAEIITEEMIVSKMCYNVAPGGSGASIDMNRKPHSVPHSKEAKEKIRVAMIGRTHTDATKEAISENNFSKRDPERQREHARMLGKRPKSEAHKKAISDAHKRRHAAKLT